MNTYSIDYELEVGGETVYRNTAVAAETARNALDEFFRDHPGAEIRELRRSHVR